MVTLQLMHRDLPGVLTRSTHWGPTPMPILDTRIKSLTLDCSPG